MPRVQHSKLANNRAENASRKAPKSRFNNGKKQLSGPARLAENVTLAPARKSARILGLARAGTDRAIKDKVLSGATIATADGPVTRSHEPCRNRKIGRFTEAAQSKVERSSKGRRSTALRLSEVRNIMAAAVFAAQEHRPLNRHTTIHFDKCGIADPVTALRRYTKLARDWLATQGAPFAYIWVRESGEGKGEHAHLAMHVPARLISAFARRERGWRKRIGAKRVLGAFRSTAVGRSYRHGEAGIQFGQPYREELAGIIGYLVKGAEPRAVEMLDLNRVESGGELWGKRSGMSENINRSARARAAIK